MIPVTILWVCLFPDTFQKTIWSCILNLTIGWESFLYFLGPWSSGEGSYPASRAECYMSGIHSTQLLNLTITKKQLLACMLQAYWKGGNPWRFWSTGYFFLTLQQGCALGGLQWPLGGAFITCKLVSLADCYCFWWLSELKRCHRKWPQCRLNMRVCQNCGHGTGNSPEKRKYSSRIWKLLNDSEKLLTSSLTTMWSSKTCLCFLTFSIVYGDEVINPNSRWNCRLSYFLSYSSIQTRGPTHPRPSLGVLPAYQPLSSSPSG